jgi:hypothetical protein
MCAGIVSLHEAACLGTANNSAAVERVVSKLRSLTCEQTHSKRSYCQYQGISAGIYRCDPVDVMSAWPAVTGYQQYLQAPGLALRTAVHMSHSLRVAETALMQP